jgi:hypothetical protein
MFKLGLEEAGFVLRAEVDVVEHQSERACFFDRGGYGRRRFDPSGKFTAPEIRLIVLLSVFQPPQEHLTEFHVVVFGSGTACHLNAGFYQVVHIAQCQGISLGAVLVGIELAQRRSVQRRRTGVAGRNAAVNFVAAKLDPANKDSAE